MPIDVQAVWDSGFVIECFSGPDPPARPCTANGYHNVTSLNLKGSKDFCEEGSTRFDEVTSKCETPETLQFIQNCDKEAKSGFVNQ